MLELRNGQRKSKEEDTFKPSVEPQEPNIFSQLSKDLNQDNLHYINSLLKGRSSSHSQGDLHLIKPVQNPPDLEETEKNHSRAKSFFDKPQNEEIRTVQKAASSNSLKQIKYDPLDTPNGGAGKIHYAKMQVYSISEVQSNSSAFNSNNTSQQTQILVLQDQVDEKSKIINTSKISPPQTETSYDLKEDFHSHEKLFDQFFKQNSSAADNQSNSPPNSFLDFIDNQINYHSIQTQAKQSKDKHSKNDCLTVAEVKAIIDENASLKEQIRLLNKKLRVSSQQKKQILLEYQNYKQKHEDKKKILKQLAKDSTCQQKEISHYKEEIKLLKKQCSQAQKRQNCIYELLVRERMDRDSSINILNNFLQTHKHEIGQKKIQEIIQAMHNNSQKHKIVQETVSSLADEIFESSDHESSQTLESEHTDVN